MHIRWIRRRDGALCVSGLPVRLMPVGRKGFLVEADGLAPEPVSCRGAAERRVREIARAWTSLLDLPDPMAGRKRAR